MIIEQINIERGDWLQTFSGIQIFPNDPKPKDFYIEDIARGLGNMPRFNGQTIKFYSVAQHCVVGSYQAPKEHALAFLLHDATEAFLADLVRPAKRQLPDYVAMEKKMGRAISEKFNLPIEMHPLVKEVDNRMLVTEARQILSGAGIRWWENKNSCDYAVPYPIVIKPWTPERSRREFLERYYQLCPEIVHE